ncbi:MAG: NAD-dependent epimerase/dehydratase family protein [bacterium]|nr:MAG: NAD-dependent epimerase/dehydratase family protein [bacterium]
MRQIKKSEKVLITGVSGEVGYGLVKKLFESKKYNIIAVDIKTPEQDIIKNTHKFIKSDILDFKILESIFKNNDIDTVIHLASILSTGGEKNPELASDINIMGTLNLFKLATKYSIKNKKSIKFIFPSSIAAHGDPITIYGISKQACEKIGVYYSKRYKLLDVEIDRKNLIDFRCVRFPGLLSPDTLPSGGTSDYGSEMLHSAAQKKKYFCFVRPNTTIPFMAMDDAVTILYQLLTTEKEKLTQNIYEVSGFSVSAKDIEKKTAQAFPDAKIIYRINPERQKIVDSWPKRVGSKEAISDWGYSLKYDFEKTFSKYLIPKISKKYER